MKSLFVAALLAAGLAVPSAFAQTDADTDASINDTLGAPDAYHAAFDAIQTAVAADDAAALAQWVSFPIEVRVGGARTIEDAGQFAADYESIVTDEIRQAILDQQWAGLFVNYQGVMFGDGQVWINGICKDDACATFDVRIVTIQSTH